MSVGALLWTNVTDRGRSFPTDASRFEPMHDLAPPVPLDAVDVAIELAEWALVDVLDVVIEARVEVDPPLPPDDVDAPSPQARPR